MSGGALRVTLDGAQIARLGNMMAAAGAQLPLGIARALNHSGDKARTAMARELVGQTGLKYGTMRRALKAKRAGAGDLAYEIRARGGDVRAQFFKPRETQGGVSAAPWNQRRVYAKSFMKGGRFPNRHGGPHGGRGVYQRVGRGRFPIKSVRTGLYIPEEMVKGGSKETFYAVVNASLTERLVHELARILGGSG